MKFIAYALFLVCSVAHAVIVLPTLKTNYTLAWDEPTNGIPPFAYRLYWGDATRHYTNFIQTPGLTATVSNMNSDDDIFMAATSLATNLSGKVMESIFSNELPLPMATNSHVVIWIQASPNITGPWTNVPNTTFFDKTNPVGQQIFFRLSITNTLF